MTLRNERVRKELMREISDILRRDIQDARISGVVSIVGRYRKNIVITS